MNARKISVWSTASGSSAFIRECPFPISRIIISERPAAWRGGVKARLDHVCRLPIGWDGYDGNPVDFSTANFALNILEGVCDADTPAPSIVPGPAGDLQIEWHTTEWDLEIDVGGPYRVEAWRRNAISGREETLSLTNDFTEIRRWVGEIAEPMIARSAAA